MRPGWGASGGGDGDDSGGMDVEVKEIVKVTHLIRIGVQISTGGISRYTESHDRYSTYR